MNNQKININKCLCCFEALKNNESYYHSHCSQNLFNTLQPPVLEFSKNDIEKLALNFLLKHQTVTGVQKKLSLTLHSETANTKKGLTIVGALGGQYILKPPTSAYPFMPELECLSMRLADICGIKVASCGLIYFQDKSLAYITKRFDRIEQKKLACEDLCQLSELSTEHKYRSTAEKAGKIIRKYSSFPGDDLLRYFELTLFSFLIGNADMHLKNFSLLIDLKKIIRLSPAYDLLSTRLLISKKEDNEELVLSINGKKSNLKKHDFNFLADNLKIPKKSANFIIENLLSKKEIMFEIIQKSFLPAKMQEDYIALIEERSFLLKYDEK